MTSVRKLAIDGHESKVGAERARAWSDAERSHLLESIAKLPDAREYALVLPYEVAAALLSARYSKRDTCWWVEREQAKLLIPYGLCEVGKNLSRHAIGAFGRQVMREFKRDGLA